jgi:hypothetical protein
MMKYNFEQKNIFVVFDEKKVPLLFMSRHEFLVDFEPWNDFYLIHCNDFLLACKLSDET